MGRLGVVTIALAIGLALPVAAQHPSRPTDTQSGTRGDPNRCPPPVVGGVVPKNWSCPTKPQVVPRQPARPTECALAESAPSPIVRAHYGTQLAQAGTNLFIGKTPMIETDHNYRCFIKFLLVPRARQDSEVFRTGSMAQIKQAGLEYPVRRQIFDAMTTGLESHFKDLEAAKRNFDIRVHIIEFMLALKHPGRCSYFDRDEQLSVDGKWVAVKDNRAPHGYALNSTPGATPHEAIMGFRNGTSQIECQAAAQLVLLAAADAAHGPAGFDALHAGGLKLVGVFLGEDDTSAKRHVGLYRGGAIPVTKMIPGDYVYLQNRHDYREYDSTGYWNGENGFYMGRYNLGPGNKPLWSATAPQRFSGLGKYSLTEMQLRTEMAAALNRAFDKFLEHKSPAEQLARRAIFLPARPEHMLWTQWGRIRNGD